MSKSMFDGLSTGQTCGVVAIAAIILIVLFIFSHYLYTDVRGYLEFLPPLTMWQFAKVIVLANLVRQFVLGNVNTSK